MSRTPLLPLLGSFLLPLLALLAGANAQAASDRSASLDAGKKVYREHCQRCHGKEGRGNGPDAMRLGFHPRDFTLGSFKCRCTPTGSLPRDEDLLRVVARGLPGTSMTGFGDKLSESERRSVVEYVKSLAPVFAEEKAPPCLEVPEPAAETPESVAEGRQVYRLLKCWTCHGVAGRGDGPAAKTLLDDWGNRLRVHNFTRPGRFKCGGEDADLYRLLQSGLAGSPMPSYSTALEFARDQVGTFEALEELFGADALAELRVYLAGQPDAATLRATPESERKALGDRRAWALIHYLRSRVGS